jgi:hypothetical protein
MQCMQRADEKALKFNFCKFRIIFFSFKLENNKMNRTKQSSKDFVLVAWKDSDVPDLIKDKTFAGMLANPANKGISFHFFN